MTLGERNSSPPPWLAYVSPSHWGAYGPRTSPLARHLLRRPQHCAPLDFWAHGPVDASVHLLKWTGAFPGSGPGTSSRARLDFPGTTCREPSPGRLPGKPSSGPGTSSRARLPSLARLARDTCATFPGHALPGVPRAVPLPPKTEQRAYPLFSLVTVFWPTRPDVLVPPEPGRRQSSHLENIWQLGLPEEMLLGVSRIRGGDAA